MLEPGASLHGEVHGNQRRRAGGLDVDARAAQIEPIGDTGRQEVLVVAGVPDEEPAEFVDELLIRQEVVQQIGVRTTAGEEPDRPGEPFRDLTRRLEGFPCTLHEQAMLRIHQRRVARTDSEERRIELLDIGDQRDDGIAAVGVGEAAATLDRSRCLLFGSRT